MRARFLVLAVLGSLLTPGPAATEQAEYVITFSGVAVRGFMGLFDTPALAHLDQNETPVAPTEPGVRPVDPALGNVASAPRSRPGPVDMLRGRSTRPMAFAPGQGTANPSFVQHGFLVEAFWAVRTGSPDGYFKHAHFHPPDLASGFEGQHFGNPNELHGLFIRATDGKPFGVKSLRYRVTRNRELPRKPFSIEGFRNYDVNVLVSRTFDPRLPVRSQFVGFPIGLPTGSDVALPWWTLPVTGFEFVDQVYIASSASVDLDDIVLTRFGPAEDAEKDGEK
jgi:hypothetical protein